MGNPIEYIRISHINSINHLNPYFTTTKNIIYFRISSFSGVIPLPYEDKQFSYNLGVYFEPREDVLLHNHDVNLVIFDNLSDFKYNTDLLRNSYLITVHLCNSIDEARAIYTQCKNFKELTHSIVERYNRTFTNLLLLIGDHAKTRNRRGLVNVVGEISKFLFGTLDSKDANHFNQEINKFSKNEHDLMDLMKRQTHIVQSTLTTLNTTLTNTMANEETLTKSLATLVKQTYLLRNETQSLVVKENLNSHFNTFSILLTVYQEILDNIINSIIAVKSGIIHPSVISSITLINKLYELVPHLPSGSRFPMEPNLNNFHSLIDIVDLSVYYKNDVLVYVINVPLVSVINYKLFKILPLPTKQSSNIYIFIQPKYEYLAIDISRQHYVVFKELEIEKCKIINHVKICDHDQPTALTINDEVCEMKLFSYPSSLPATCETKVIHLTHNLYHKLYKQNAWLYTIVNKELLTISCVDEPQVTNVQLIDVGIFKLNGKCKAYTNAFVLESKQKLTLNFTEGIMPPFNLDLDICFNNSLKDIEKLRLYVPKMHNIFSYSDLEAASKSVHDVYDAIVKTQKEIDSNSYISHYSIIFYIIILLIALFIVYKIYKKFYAKRSTSDTTIRNENSVINNIFPLCCKKRKAIRVRYNNDSNADRIEMTSDEESGPSVRNAKEFNPKYK